jgi:hypothetical protein
VNHAYNLDAVLDWAMDYDIAINGKCPHAGIEVVFR